MSEEIIGCMNGLAHRVSRLANMFPIAHCMLDKRPTLVERQPAPTYVTCLYCLASRAPSR